MTLRDLLALATKTLAQVPHYKAVTPQLCAAICWVESSGNQHALGDGGQARGLAQFHARTWKWFSCKRCAAHAGAQPDWAIHAECSECSMRALIAELNAAARRIPRICKVSDSYRFRWLCNFHNLGRWTDANTTYCRRVKAIVDSLAPPAHGSRVAGRGSSRRFSGTRLKAQGSRL